jgi:hypothetical protein
LFSINTTVSEEESGTKEKQEVEKNYFHPGTIRPLLVKIPDDLPPTLLLYCGRRSES